MKPALGALLLGATCIALSPIFVRVSEAGPTATAFWRVALAVPPLWLLYALRREQAPRTYPAKWPLLLAAGAAVPRRTRGGACGRRAASQYEPRVFRHSTDRRRPRRGDRNLLRGLSACGQRITRPG